jgi:hypothetical protein
MVTVETVVLDEGSNLSFEVTGEKVVLRRDAVLQGLVPPFDLALNLLVVDPHDVSKSLRAILIHGGSSPLGRFGSANPT